MSVAIHADHLRLTYPAPGGRRVGVGPKDEGLSFEVNEGEIFGVIGPDGAGKTTLFRILCSLLKPQHGTARVAGYDTLTEYKELRKHIGYMPGVFSLYGDLTVEENMNFFATIFGTTVEENYHLVKDIYAHIEPYKKRKAKSLSGGMKQKLALSCALIHSPQILFLDEPTTGIDPISRVDLWDMLKKLSRDGVTVVVSTAYMDEAKQCDRIAFMNGGHFMAIDSPQNLEQSYAHKLYSVRSDQRLELLNHLRAFEGAVQAFAFGETFHVSLQDEVTEEDLKDYLAHADGLTGISIEQTMPTLEDTFLAMSIEER